MKKFIIIILAFLGIATIGAALSDESQSLYESTTTPTPTETTVTPPTTQVESATTPVKPKPAEASPTPTGEGLSNDNYYTNSAGETVHSPAYSDVTPEGATAICGDGTYSFSRSRRGTCSHHGGVASWLY